MAGRTPSTARILEKLGEKPIVCNLLLGGIDGSIENGLLIELVAIKLLRLHLKFQEASDPSSSNGRSRTSPNHRQHQMDYDQGDLR
ncbi:unnamed protein product [Bursaphelenchus okinawaensis]|uniref:Uncharacterized protein n=1 Tax=Bursaphelenchus okinawaensis TaxID=465554 RepID=A0A811JQR8_9BILA|nr:unnamed protein product [Bursaphelenchus okinawaensis]CAG9078990.1 unnamed protein product [Bursaphelenchus okinawaensis]